MHSPFKAYGHISSTFEDVEDAGIASVEISKPSSKAALNELTAKKKYFFMTSTEQ